MAFRTITPKRLTAPRPMTKPLSDELVLLWRMKIPLSGTEPQKAIHTYKFSSANK